VKIGADAVLLCAGRHGRFAMEDAVCAGILAHRIRKAAGSVRFNDAAHAAMLVARRYRKTLESLLQRTAGGRQLARAGYALDIPFCAELDAHTNLPRYHERRVTF
jgi:2-phosphosulfolactate phosphatase